VVTRSKIIIPELFGVNVSVFKAIIKNLLFEKS